MDYFVGLFPFQPFFKSRADSKHLREGHYNLFLVTALKHVALYYLIYCTLDFFDIKLLSQNNIYCPDVCQWFCPIVEIQKRSGSIDDVMKAGHACSLGRTSSRSNAISGLHQLVYQPFLSVCKTLLWSNDLYSNYCACSCLCFPPSGCKHKAYSQWVQLTDTCMS